MFFQYMQGLKYPPKIGENLGLKNQVSARPETESGIYASISNFHQKRKKKSHISVFCADFSILVMVLQFIIKISGYFDNLLLIFLKASPPSQLFVNLLV